MDIYRCFPHIVNLACKAVLAALSHTDYVEDENAEAGTTHSDPIGTLRALVRAVSNILTLLEVAVSSQIMLRFVLPLFDASILPRLLRISVWSFSSCETLIHAGLQHYT